MKKTITTLLAVITLGSCTEQKTKNYDKCGYKTMLPGDTIIYRYPNIPNNIRVNHASIMYYSKTDSIVVTYNYELDSCK